jgi:hypothetical protein
MAAAGYAPGDTWAINELSSAVRTKPASQARARDAMRGLYTGPRGAPPQQGAVFVVGLGQQLVNFGPYKGQLEGWLDNAAWWTAVWPYVAWWAQEAYPSCSRVCVAGTKVGVRSTRLNEFREGMEVRPLRVDGVDGCAPARLRLVPNRGEDDVVVGARRLICRQRCGQRLPAILSVDDDLRLVRAGCGRRRAG